MSKEYHGSCMCRSIRFSFFGPPRFVADCVCESCRTAHGASAVCWVGVKDVQFSIDSGEQLLRWYRSSPESERGFCSACGTRVLFRSHKWPGEMHLTLASVDPFHDLRSTGVAFGEEFPGWTALQLPPA